jgi:hypothetical protein
MAASIARIRRHTLIHDYELGCDSALRVRADHAYEKIDLSRTCKCLGTARFSCGTLPVAELSFESPRIDKVRSIVKEAATTHATE